MKAARAGASYFALVFAAGFVLGVVRVIFLVPRFGERYAELGELPMMLVVIYYAAKFVVSRSGIGDKRVSALLAGTVALVLMLVFESTLVLYVRGLSLSDYIGTRDWLSGSAYAISLVIFWLMPFALARSKPSLRSG